MAKTTSFSFEALLRTNDIHVFQSSGLSRFKNDRLLMIMHPKLQSRGGLVEKRAEKRNVSRDDSKSRLRAYLRDKREKSRQTIRKMNPVERAKSKVLFLLTLFEKK